MASFSHVIQLLAFIGLLSGGVRCQMMYGNMMMPPAYMGMGMGGMGGMPGMGFPPVFGGLGGFDNDLDDMESMRLTCSNNFTDFRTGQVSDAISVTISYGDSGSSGFDFPTDPYGFYGAGASGMGNMGNMGNRGTLKAEVQILSSGIGKASVVFTERARVEDGCSTENLGAIHAPAQSSNQGSMYNGFGQMGLGMGMNLGMGGMFGGDIGLSTGVGFLKEDIKVNVNLQTIYVDNIQGFSSLGDLAGRGVAVCSDSSYGWDFQATCDGPIYMCCALKYDDHDQRINLYGYTGSQVTYS